MTTIFTGANAILGTTTVAQVMSSAHATGQTFVKPKTSGGAVIQQVSGKSMAEVTTLTSGDIGTLLALNSNLFISAGLGLSASTITVPYAARADLGVFASGSSHPAITGAKALIIPTTFEATQEGDFASITFEIHWLSADGLAKGCDDATGQALASQTFVAGYTLGPCYINGTPIAGVQSFRGTTGLEVVKPPLGSGSIAPTMASIKQVEPTLELTVNDFDAIAGTVGDFTAMTSANFYFKRRADAGVFASGSNHARVTFAAGLTDTNNINVSNNDDGTATITLHGKTMTAAAGVALP